MAGGHAPDAAGNQRRSRIGGLASVGARGLAKFAARGARPAAALALDYLDLRQERRARQLDVGLEAEAQRDLAEAFSEITNELDAATSAAAVSAAEAVIGAGAVASASSSSEQEFTSDSVSSTGPRDRTITGAVGQFYADALLQSRVWFVASVVAAFAGLVVIVWEVIQPGSLSVLDAGLKAVPAVIAEAVAVLFYRQAADVRKHASNLLTTTEVDRRAEMARQILSTIQDKERREEIAARLATHFAGTRTASISQRRRQGRPEAERADEE